MIKKYLLISVTLLCIFGCGHYSFYTRSNPHLKTVMITEFDNDSEQYELPGLVTEYLTEAFIEDNRLDVQGDDADLDIMGTIRSYKRVVNAYDMQEDPSEWKVTIVFQIEAKDLVRDEVIWQNNSLSLSATYGSGTAAEEEDGQGIELFSEEDAQKSIIFELCNVILSNTIEQW
ncbi:MAG: LptE family protein [Candidatus Cloacimonetes bacterium]|nr:LptE family protein [Candidatus Cloacimonadota bacterium]